MEVPTRKAAVILVVIVLVFSDIAVVLGRSRHYSRSGVPKDQESAADNHHHHNHQTKYLGRSKGRSKSMQFEADKERSWRSSNGRPETMQVAGSKLPDCSHACGSCSPCRLVMVSFICSSIQEAETCPMAYKCMCKSKSYPVP